MTGMAVGGTRFQTFDDQLSNVRRALKNSAGIDPEADGRLVERINDLEDAKAAALEFGQYRCGGHDYAASANTGDVRRSACRSEETDRAAG
jgi:hypothetical protein